MVTSGGRAAVVRQVLCATAACMLAARCLSCSGDSRQAADAPGVGARSGSAAAATAAQPVEPARLAAARAARPLFGSYVFSDTLFPAVQLTDTASLRSAMGPYTVTAEFYDVQYRSVEKARPPGRYGAVVTVASRDNPAVVVKHRVTLFRLPFGMDADAIAYPFRRPTLTSLAIDPSSADVLPVLPASAAAALRSARPSRVPEGAILLAAMYDAASSGFAAGRKADALAMDSVWWSRLQAR